MLFCLISPDLFLLYGLMYPLIEVCFPESVEKSLYSMVVWFFIIFRQLSGRRPEMLSLLAMAIRIPVAEASFVLVSRE